MARRLMPFRYAFRTLRKSPGFALVAITTLAIGIAANTTIFSVVNGLLLKPLPVAHPNQVVSLFTSDYSGPRYGTSSYPDYVDFRARTQTLSGLAAYEFTPLSLGAGDAAARELGEVVSGNYFDVLGVVPARGRGFRPEEDTAPGAHAVAVIGYDVWQRQFGADPAIVGRAVPINGQSFTIVGVAPRGYTGLTRGLDVEVWVPMAMMNVAVPGSDDLTNRSGRSLQLAGRLKPDATASAAQAEFAVIARQLHAAYPSEWTDVHHQSRVVTVVPERQARILPALRGPVSAFLLLLACVVGLVLLLACANVANLMLARAATRRGEMAIRLALGAGRRQLVSQLLAESVLLGAIAGGVGLIAAMWATDLLTALRPPLPVPVALDFSIDGRVLAFAAGISLLTGVIFGLAPALSTSRVSIVPALKNTDRTGGSGHSARLRNFFVVSQVALSVLLLVGAGLFLRSLSHAAAIDPGFDPHGVLIGSLDLQLHGYDDVSGPRFLRDLFGRLRTLPGVSSVSATTNLPLGLLNTRRGITIEGYTPKADEDVEISTASVGPDYFATMKAPIVRGRGVTPRDVQGSPRAVVVNEAFARRYWPGQNPIGRHIQMGGQADASAPRWEVVGVARDGKYSSLDESPKPFFFTPLLQFYRPNVTVVVRTAGAPLALADAVRHTIEQMNPSMPLFATGTLEQHLGLALLPARLAGWLVGIIGLVALALAALGLYGAMAYATAQRTHEIGIRMALGADGRTVFRLIMRQGLWLTTIGTAIGLAAAVVLTRFTASLLYGLSPTDPITFAAAVLVLGVTAFAACSLPTRRATRVDPVVALRNE